MSVRSLERVRTFSWSFAERRTSFAPNDLHNSEYHVRSFYGVRQCDGSEKNSSFTPVTITRGELEVFTGKTSECTAASAARIVGRLDPRHGLKFARDC